MPRHGRQTKSLQTRCALGKFAARNSTNAARDFNGLVCDPCRGLVFATGVDSQMTSHSLQDMYRRPGFLLKRCHQVSMAIFLDGCREFNLTQSQYGCLRALEVYPGVDQIA